MRLLLDARVTPRRASASLLLPALLAGCVAEPLETAAPPDAPPATAQVPEGWLAEVQARMEASERSFEPDGPGFVGRAGGLRAQFDADGAWLHVGSDRFTLRTGGGGPAPVAPTLGACVDDVVGVDGQCVRRLEYRGGERTEWWQATSSGLPKMRFRTELHGWVRTIPPATNWPVFSGWLRAVLEEGLVAEMQWWQRVQVHQAQVALAAAAASLFPFNFGAYPSSTPYALGYTFADWISFETMGVHNDVEGPATAYAKVPDCWRRPTWYMFRRLAWLVNQSATISVAYAARGFTCIQFDLVAAVGTGPDGTAFVRSWSRAFLFWLDQYDDRPALHVAGDADVLSAR